MIDCHTSFLFPQKVCDKLGRNPRNDSFNLMMQCTVDIKTVQLYVFILLRGQRLAVLTAFQ